MIGLLCDEKNYNNMLSRFHTKAERSGHTELGAYYQYRSSVRVTINSLNLTFEAVGFQFSFSPFCVFCFIILSLDPLQEAALWTAPDICLSVYLTNHTQCNVKKNRLG